MIAVQTNPYPERPLFHRMRPGLPVYRPFLAFRGAQEGLGLMIVQDDSGRPTAVIRKFESPYHMYRHYNPGFRGLGGYSASEVATVGVIAALFVGGWYVLSKSMSKARERERAMGIEMLKSWK